MSTPLVDLSDQAPPSGNLPEPSFDPSSVRESARRTIAFTLLFFLGGILLAGLVVVFLQSFVELQRAKDLFTLLLTPIVGLVGSVVGFYFGAQTAEAARSSDGGTR